jgi:hypothetical protein
MPAQRNALGLPSHTNHQALKGRPKPMDSSQTCDNKHSVLSFVHLAASCKNPIFLSSASSAPLAREAGGREKLFGISERFSRRGRGGADKKTQQGAFVSRPEGANYVSPAQGAGSPQPPTPPSPERAAHATSRRSLSFLRADSGDRNRPVRTRTPGGVGAGG